MVCASRQSALRCVASETATASALENCSHTAMIVNARYTPYTSPIIEYMNPANSLFSSSTGYSTRRRSRYTPQSTTMTLTHTQRSRSGMELTALDLQAADAGEEVDADDGPEVPVCQGTINGSPSHGVALL